MPCVLQKKTMRAEKTTEMPKRRSRTMTNELTSAPFRPRSCRFLQFFYSLNPQVVHADNTGRLRTPFECVQREVRGGNRAAFCFNSFVFFLSLEVEPLAVGADAAGFVGVVGGGERGDCAIGAHALRFHRALERD